MRGRYRGEIKLGLDLPLKSTLLRTRLLSVVKNMYNIGEEWTEGGDTTWVSSEQKFERQSNHLSDDQRSTEKLRGYQEFLK